MCGIAGYNVYESAESSQLALLATVLAFQIENRGRQSWGIFDDMKLEKGIGPISHNLLLPKSMPYQFCLHTRQATHGSITKENAHPFSFPTDEGPLVGCHNGIISNHYELNRKYKTNFEVDSQHIFKHLADGLDLADLVGYGAIVYRRGTQWYFGTFNHGDLVIANTSIGKVYASTKEAVQNACRIAGVKIHTWDKPQDDMIYSFDANTSYEEMKIEASSTSRFWEEWIGPDGGKKNSHGFSNATNTVTPGFEYFTTWQEGSIFDTRLRMYRRPALQLPAPSLKVCVSCKQDVEEDYWFMNAEKDVVCQGCADLRYQFLASDEYAMNEPGKCSLCDSFRQLFLIKKENVSICWNCLEASYTTKGLTKIQKEVSA